MPKVTAPAAMSVSAGPFVPPPVEVGQVVLWSYGSSERPAPAMVTKTGTGTVTLAVHIDGIKDHVTRNGVRHVNDPYLASHPHHDQGVWDLTPRDKRINALLENYGSSILGEE